MPAASPEAPPARDPEMLTLSDIARLFGVSAETARRITRQSRFPLFQSELVIRMPKAAFLKWLAQECGQDEA